MNSKFRFLAVIAATAICIATIVTAWDAIHFVDWASDLPNRIAIQIDERSAVRAVTWLVTESARASLAQPDPEQQLQCLNALIDGIKSNPESIPWIQTEFAEELTALQTSSNAEVASLADELASAAQVPQPTAQTGR
jgi:hypothetical protein